MLCTQWNWPAERPLRPNEPRICPLSREQHPHLVVLAVRGVQMRLRGIGREVEIPGRAGAARLRRHDELTHEGAVLAEDLDAVVRAVAHVEQPVAREAHAVHGVARSPLTLGSPGRPAVGAPVALVGCRCRRRRRSPGGCRSRRPRYSSRVAGSTTMLAGRLRCVVSLSSPIDPGLADLQQELAVSRELQDHPVLGAVAGQPDVVLVVHVDAVLVVGPRLSGGGAAPRLHEGAASGRTRGRAAPAGSTATAAASAWRPSRRR